MTPFKKDMIKKNDLEKLLVSHWTEILDYRLLLDSLRELVVPNKIKSYKITRFDIFPQGFALWVEVTLQLQPSNVNKIFEFFLSNTGDLFLLNDI